jgi:hypothetical protein
MAAAEFVRGMAVIFGFMGSLVVGDLNMVSVLPFPSEDDAPWGFPGVCVDGVFRGSFEFVVMKDRDEQEEFFVGFVEDGGLFRVFVISPLAGFLRYP